jgi:transcription elongation GreA/GreB family factor
MAIFASDDAYGDGWHDNFAFEEAKREELRIQNLINQKVNQLKNIVIVEDLQDDLLIEIDDYIDVEMTYEDEESERMIFKLVGSNTPDIKTAIPQISLNSPLGKSVYGKRKGDVTSYQVNNFTVNVHINNKAKSLDELQEIEYKKGRK